MMTAQTRDVLSYVRALCLIAVCLVSFSGPFALASDRANGQAVSWSPSQIAVNATVGERTTIHVQLTPRKQLRNVDVYISRVLVPYVKVSPNRFAVLKNKVPITISIDLTTTSLPFEVHGDLWLQTDSGDDHREGHRKRERVASVLPIKIIGLAKNAYAVTGYVTPGQSVTVTAAGPVSESALTDSSGVFSIDGLPPGVYTVSPTRAGSTFSPVSQDVTVVDRDVTGLVFEATEPGEGLSNEILQQLDATPDSSLPPHEVILPNGMPLDDYLLMRGITLDGETAPAPPTNSGALTSQSAVATSALPPSAGPQQKKNDVVAAMLGNARKYACGRGNPRCTSWDYAADPVIPTTMP